MSAGLVLITPSSVTGSVGATINTNGSVSFSSASVLQLNDVFTSTYDNYRIVFRGTASAGDSLIARWVDGTTPSATANYQFQQYQVNGTAITGARNQQDYTIIASIGSYGPTGLVVDVYGPKLAQQTAYRSVSVYAGTSNSTVQIAEWAGTHDLTGTYEGIYVGPILGATWSGKIAVYGWNQ